jgi:hypothetical protein
MNDVFFVAGTFGFFALMLAYVAACDRLGRTQNAEATSHERR